MHKQEDEPQAAKFMTRKLYVVTPDLPLKDIVSYLLKHRISNVPVVEEQKGKRHLVGFISERDCLAAISNEAFFGNPSPPQTARTIMRLHPVCIAPETRLFSLVSIFVNHDYRHLPVVKDGELLGIVSRRDILKAVETHYEHMLDEQEHEHFPPDLTKIINHRFLIEHG